MHLDVLRHKTFIKWFLWQSFLHWVISWRFCQESRRSSRSASLRLESSLWSQGASPQAAVKTRAEPLYIPPCVAKKWKSSKTSQHLCRICFIYIYILCFWQETDKDFCSDHCDTRIFVTLHNSHNCTSCGYKYNDSSKDLLRPLNDLSGMPHLSHAAPHRGTLTAGFAVLSCSHCWWGALHWEMLVHILQKEVRTLIVQLSSRYCPVLLYCRHFATCKS